MTLKDMTNEFSFSSRDHVHFLSGYLDAIGRVLTTDSLFYGLSANLIDTGQDVTSVLGMKVQRRQLIENWSREFGKFVEETLRENQKDRHMFYLIDYIVWFKDFTDEAICYKLRCDPLYSDTISQAIYLLEIENSISVLLTMYVSSKEKSDINPLARNRTEISQN